MRGIPLILIAILLAGCMGGAKEAEPIQSADATEGSPSQPSSSRPMPTPSPTAAPSKPSANAPPAQNTTATDNATPTVTKVAYEWSSTLNPEVCAPLPTLGCAGLLDAANWWDRPDIPGTLKHAKVDLAWTAEPTGSAQLRFALVDAVACEGDGCWEGEVILETSGPSPLALESDVALAEGHFLVVVVRPASLTPDPAYSFAHTEQPFTVTGEWTSES